MDRTFASDLQQLGSEAWIGAAFNADYPLEPVYSAFASLGCVTAVGAVLDRRLSVPNLDGDTAELELLVLSVDAQRHCRAGPERNRQIVVRAWSGVEAADRNRFVGQQAMPSSHDDILELPLACFATRT